MPPSRKTGRGKRWVTFASICIWLCLLGLLITAWHRQHAQASFSPHARSVNEDLLLRMEADGTPKCPFPYDRHSPEDIAQGQTPYLFGGTRKPQCRHCGSDSVWSNFCKFDNEFPGNPACGKQRKQWLIEGFLERQFFDILTVTPCDLFQLVRSRTLWVVGDSQSLDMSKALQCFLHEFWDLEMRNLSSADPSVAPKLDQLRTAQCANLVGSTRLCYLRADQPKTVLDLVIPILMSWGHPHDILLLTVGLHFTPDYEGALTKISAQFRDHVTKLPFLLWMDTPPQHFLTDLGEYPKDGTSPPYNCWYIGKAHNVDPLRVTKDHQLTTVDPIYQSVADGGWRNIIARSVMDKAHVPVLQIWNESMLLWNYHRDNGAGWECTHFCFPSAPQVWVYHLIIKLQELQTLNLLT